MYMADAVKIVQNFTRSEVIARALQSGDLSRMELVRETNFKRTTVFDNLVRLEIAGEVTRYIVREKKRGRPVVKYQLI